MTNCNAHAQNDGGMLTKRSECTQIRGDAADLPGGNGEDSPAGRPARLRRLRV